MLAIRLQRRGRKGHAQYRVIVQESQLSPKSERVVAALGSYDPHTKAAILDTEKAEFYLSHGAQPSNRVAMIFQAEKVALPDWVQVDTAQSRSTKNPEKLRKNQPDEPKVETPKNDTEEAAPKEEAEVVEEKTEEKVEDVKESTDEPKAEDTTKEAPAEEKTEEK